MSAAHTCTRNALVQAFRAPSAPSCAAPRSVPAFLVPALAPPVRRRRFCSGQQRQQPQQPQRQKRQKRPSLKSSRPPWTPHAPLLEPVAHRDLEQWLAAVDRCLPPHLQHPPFLHRDRTASITSLDLCWLLVRAQDAAHDLLSHMGLVQRRWEAVMWIVKKLLEQSRRAMGPSKQLALMTSTIASENRMLSLDKLTGEPVPTNRPRRRRKLRHSLDDLTAGPDSIDLHHTIARRALGQLWRTLAAMTLAAVEQDPRDEQDIMSRVLEIIAHAHHVGFIPDSVYAYKPSQDPHSLQQPPTLHLLSSHILTALSDATWRAHEASVKDAKLRMNASYIFGREIPGSRFKVQVAEVAPELWLELILWSTLHGGWIMDGMAILESLTALRTGLEWHPISWQELAQDGDVNVAATDRSRTQRTISSELVTAFVDALVGEVRVGVGSRGVEPEKVIAHLKTLKSFLHRSQLSLGSATWDSIILRLLASGAVVPETRPELLLSMADLASEFGEAGAANAPVRKGFEPAYFFEPTTVLLCIFHRTLQSFINYGDLSGALQTLYKLLEYTDKNKQASLRQFFEKLRKVPYDEHNLFISRLPPLDFPAFEAQLSAPLLARLLNLATEAKAYDIGQSLLFEEYLDGPLIPRSMWEDHTMAASIINLGTMSGEHHLVSRVIKTRKLLIRSDEPRTLLMPAEVLTALICSQIKLHRWESVRSMQEHVLERAMYWPRPEILSTFVAELLRLSSNDGFERSCEAFTGLLFAWEDLVLTCIGDQLRCMLGILSTVSPFWHAYCSQFLAFPTHQDADLSTEDFNKILGGVLDGYGSLKARELVDLWCSSAPMAFEQYRAPGGLPNMPKVRVGRAEEYESRPPDIEIYQDNGAKMIYSMRILANRQTIRAILQKVQEEENLRAQSGEALAPEVRVRVRTTLKWAVRLLYRLGLEYEDIVRDLGVLADIAELESPHTISATGIPE